MKAFFRTCLIIMTGCLVLPGCSTAQEPAPRPNILVILADDLGYNDVGFTGATDIQTPVLDKLARDGVVFSNGYVTHPYCGPSRAGLLTGRYQARFGMENNVSYSPQDPYMGLPVTEITLADRLRALGYRTGIIGKWHLGAAPHFQPNNRGFDYFYGFLDGGHNYMPSEIEIHAGGYLSPILRNKRPAEFDEYLTTALSRDAARFVESNNDQPFFLYLSYNAPHTPLQAPEAVIEKYDFIEDENRRVYAAMVDTMDQGIGLVIDALKQAGKFDNTLIFFLSDNGGVYPEEWMADHNWADNSPYRRGKASLLEGGVKVPFMAHWTAGMKGGRDFDGLVSSLDIAATSVVVAGGEIDGTTLDGRDLNGALNGEDEQGHDALYWRMEEADQLWAIRTPDAKYLNQTLPEVGLSYFDMRNDPAETNNLVNSAQARRGELARLWNEWNAENLNNVLQQSWEYSETQRRIYDAINAENMKQAEERQPYRIK